MNFSRRVVLRALWQRLAQLAARTTETVGVCVPLIYARPLLLPAVAPPPKQALRMEQVHDDFLCWDLQQDVVAFAARRAGKQQRPAGAEALPGGVPVRFADGLPQYVDIFRCATGCEGLVGACASCGRPVAVSR